MTRPVLLTAGLSVLACAWLLVPAVPAPAFSAHMAAHMAVVALAAPLLALAIAGGPLDPTLRAPRAVSPIVASMLELVLVWAWHAPALHHAARHQPAIGALEQLSFLAAGLFLWVAALGGDRKLRHQRAAAGVTGLLLTSMHMTLLGALLVLGQRPLFGHGGGAGLSPLHDQQLGGAIMIVLGGAAYLAGALCLTADLLRQRQGDAA